MLSNTFWKICLAWFAAFLLTACSSEPTPPPTLIFDVTTNSNANAGGLFYFVVRSANEKQFMLETYQGVASKAFADQPDTNSSGVFSIVPGTQQECVVSLPAQGTVALYFLLTQPGSQWKKLLSLPLADKYNINLTANSQIEISEDRPWYSFASWF